MLLLERYETNERQMKSSKKRSISSVNPRFLIFHLKLLHSIFCYSCKLIILIHTFFEISYTTLETNTNFAHCERGQSQCSQCAA